MRKIKRRELSEQAQTMLAGRTERVAAAEDSKLQAKDSWRSKQSPSWDEIRSTLRDMCSGLERCMYCENSEATDIEHFHPKSNYPERTYNWDNYLLACSSCNSNHKRDEFPVEDGRPLLIDPTKQDPAEYLEFSPSTGQWQARRGCREGSESVRVFGLGRHAQARRNAWELFELIIRMYRKERAADNADASRYLRILRQADFSGVFAAMLRLSRHPTGQLHVHAEVIIALREHPELTELLD